MCKQKEITVLLPGDLLERVEERIKSTDFSNLSEYICFILKEIVCSDTETSDMDKGGHDEQLKKRLQNLGYID